MSDINVPSLPITSVIRELLSIYIPLIKSNLPFDSIPTPFLWGPPGVGKSDGVKEFANHLEDETGKRVIAVGAEGNCPPCTRQLLDDLKQESKVNWKVVLNDFIKAIHDKYDFSFVPPDRRFSAGDFILPSYAELTSEKVENLWFLIDTSGSISTEELTLAMGEVKSAIEQFTYLSGKISFFDTEVSEPVSFDSVDTLSEVTPIGGGGTSFRCIFKYMKEYFEDELPTAVIVLTDGYASYPSESKALDVPVLWIISGDNEEDAPWGVTIHI